MCTPSLAGQKEQKVTNISLIITSALMIINLTYIFFILVGIYFAIVTYIETRKWQVFIILVVFLFSFGLEIDRLNQAKYKLNINDFLWTTRDIMRTIVIIFCFQHARDNFPYIPKKKKATKKITKKVTKKRK